MADNNPITPGGAVPPRPAEAAKVQPKKETVRISLPPKPSSSPTIKLPTLPAGGPVASIGAAPGAVAAPAAAAPAPPAPRPPTASGGPPLTTAAAAAAARPPTATGSAVTRPPGATGMPAGSRPAAAAARKSVSGLDVGLGIAAAVVGLGAVVSLVLLLSLK